MCSSSIYQTLKISSKCCKISLRALMAALCHFPIFSCSPKINSAFRFSEQRQQLSWGAQIRKDTISASSSKNSRASVKPRAGRSLKSNAELCNELREFVSMVGLPEGYVPSLKDLLQHGRKDLANIVRRRGYKLITELLMNTTREDTNIEISSTENQDAGNVFENEPDLKVDELAKEVSSSCEHSIVENYFSSANGVSLAVSGTQNCEFVESSANLSLPEKAAKFIQDGELDTIEDKASDIGYFISTTNGIDEGESCTKLDKEIEVESGSPDEESSQNEAAGNNVAPIVNASALTSKLGVPLATEYNAQRDDFSSAEGFDCANSHEDLGVEAGERSNQVEINRLKVMLHQKELELSQLKEQIEKEKFALSTLQAKVEHEIGKAQKLMLTKDEELHVAEESLSGLKEVQIDYWGNGETVEVAGSFNGWHHQITMDSDPSSGTIRTTGSRKSKLWSTVLWLYPGLYEIKFIVDGHWMIDPQRESVTRGTIQNNILRVG